MPEEEPTVALRRPLTAVTASTTAALQILARVAGLLIVAGSTAVVTRELGPVGYADWATVFSLAAMLGFVLDPGIAPVVVRRITQAAHEVPAPSSLLRVRLILAVAAWLLVALLGLALRGADAFVLGLVLAAQLVPRAVVMNVGTWMQAEHRLHRQALLEVATTGAGLLGLVAGAVLGVSAPLLAACGVFAPSLVLALLMQRELRRLPSARGARSGRERELVLQVLREAAPLAGAIVLVSLYTRMNVVFVNAVEDDSGVAAFLFAFQFIEQIIVLAAIVAGTLLPILTTRGRTADLRTDGLTRELGLGTALLGAAGALGLMAIAEPLVLVIAGEDYREAIGHLTLLAPACLALFANFFIAYLFVAVERASRYFAYNLVGLAFAAGANAALTLPLGAEGAARVTWATEGLVASLAGVPYFSSTAAGRRLLAEVGGLAVLVVGASELIAAGVVPRISAVAVGGLAVAGGAVTLLGRRKRRTVSDLAGDVAGGPASPADR